MPAKPLSDFPRPANDNGRGVHWSTRLYHPNASELSAWIDLLQALQIKWVKLLDDGGGSSLELCRALIAGDIMPIVRLYRDRPNPGHLGGRETDTIKRLVEAGVHYFESNNEPDLAAEWENNHRPANWLEIVVDNFIIDADIILAAGGLPAFPAMGPGRRGEIAMVVERGRKDIFERGGWMAIHNYTLNHPLDYPYDDVNQNGTPISEEEFDRLAQWQYSHLTPEEAAAQGVHAADYDKYQRWAWDGRNIEMVNELRAAAKNPGDTILDDASCFRSWEYFGLMIQETLGFPVPVISTEGGPVVGWGDDKRYAKLNPTTQAEWQLAIYKFLQDEAPAWYFTCCTWLLASKTLGDFNPTWDQMSWYTHAWDLQFGLEGELPIVQMLKDTPSKVRHELRSPEGFGTVMGTVTSRAQTPLAGIGLALHNTEGMVVRSQTDSEGRYLLRAESGSYDLHVDWFGPVAHELTLGIDDADVIDITDFDPPGAYQISGTLKDPSGQPREGIEIELRRNSIVHARSMSGATGAFLFSPGLAGEYVLVTEFESATANVQPDAPDVHVELVVPPAAPPRYNLIEKRLLGENETGNRRLFFGRVTDAEGVGIKGIELEMRWTNAAPGTVFPRTRTGRDPFKPDPDGYYEFLHSPGEFSITVVQGDYESDVADKLLTTGIPGREGDPITYEVNFQLRSLLPPPPTNSIVSGSIPGGRYGQAVRLWGKGQTREIYLENSRLFRFTQLPPGVYDLELAGIGTIRSDIVLDGENEVEIYYPLLGAITGDVEESLRSAGRVMLVSESYGFVRHAQLTQDGLYRFTNLPAGQYRLEVGDAILSSLLGDGETVLRAPVVTLATDSMITGVLYGIENDPLPNRTVTLMRGDTEMAQTLTNDEGQYVFAELPAGVYALVVDAKTRAADVRLNGHNAVAVDLHITASYPEPKRFGQYYLLQLADTALHPTLVRLIAPWLKTQPQGMVGFDVDEAKRASRVTLIGDGISQETAAFLQTTGCEIVDLRMDLTQLVRFFGGEIPPPGS